jgi:hypothetical protein
MPELRHARPEVAAIRAALANAAVPVRAGHEVGV